MRRIVSVVLLHRCDAVISVSAAACGSAAQVAVPLIGRQILDTVIIDHQGVLWFWLAMLLAAAGVAFAMSYLRRYLGARVGLSVQADLRNALHDHLESFDQTTLSRLPVGQLISRANSDTALVGGLLVYLPVIGGNVLMMLLSVVVMFVISPLLALLALAILPALFAVAYRMRQQVFPASWDSQQREGELVQIVDDGITGVRVVKAFGQEQREVSRLAEAAQRLYGSRLRVTRLNARYQPVLEMIPLLAQVAVLACGGLLALHGHLTIGTFLAFSTYIAQFAAPARQLAGILTVAQQARVGVERIYQLLDQQSKIRDRENAITLDHVAGEVVFDDVTFTYMHASSLAQSSDEIAGKLPDRIESAPVLRGVSFRIAAGERVAVVGPSGSGKSTLAMLLPRFYDPDAGRILIDGQDLRDVTLHSLRRQVAVAFEESFLLSRSIRDNIAYGRPDATEAEIEAAARAAQVHEFALDLPNGYDTVVGERGLTLSGGQRQRVALARAILAAPRVLVLDDATSALDATTEEAIQDALRAVLAGRTTLLIAHRVSTLRLADRILVLDEGRIVDDGTHQELSARSPRYRELLTGLEQAADPARQAGDSVEALASLAVSAAVTASAWQSGPADPISTSKERTVQASAAGPGGRRAGRGSGAMAGLPPTPELLARVRALPPVRDHIAYDLSSESAPERSFRLRGLLFRFRRPLLFGLALVILDAAAGVAGPFLVKQGIDSGVSAGAQSALLIAASIYLVVTLADLFVEIGSTFIAGRTAERIMFSLRIRIWAQLQRLSLDYYERESAGRIMTRMTSDVDQFATLISSGLLSALVAFVTFIGVAVMLLVTNWKLGLATLTVVLPMAIALIWFRRRSHILYDAARERIAALNADFQEGLAGIREAQAFTHEDATNARFHQLNDAYLRTRVASQRLVALFFPFVQFLSAVADAVVLGLGASLIHHGSITSGTLVAFLLYIDLFFSPIQQLSQVFDSWQQTRIAVDRIAGLMATKTLTPEPEHPEVLATPATGALDLVGVRFGYPTAHGNALRDFNLTIAAGETVALVGSTGAGKSTILKLLARFYDPLDGSVRFDGHDLRALNLHTFRTQLGYVPQEAFLFAGTVRDNIAYGRPNATEAEIEAAARAVGAHDVIAALPNGYLTDLPERGGSLSAGQRQLIALARAQLVEPALLLLDEATSNLDPLSEARVNAAMRAAARNRTTIIIAHRLRTARLADRIAVLQDGRITEFGSHHDLLARNGAYASMWRAFEGTSQEESMGRPR
ncbi:ABC transporter ATP-binding protein [Paraburkholderia sp. BCC1885]|uniref:ABC transporter ATP-binding protein n=1 Tax=Paraburkholderia sp. BCC1885 TaxID=2562669 RepID=UPI001C913146|nr:ABC transporter ATP-binding protein [Paraburkholderia sp. BCC1885]